MQFSSRFTIAIHIFSCIEIFKDRKVTSSFMASSIGVNAVIVRNILGQLKSYGLIDIVRGTGGVIIKKPISTITFLDIYKAVECSCQDELFHFHEKPNEQCPVGRNIHNALDCNLAKIKTDFEQILEGITLDCVIDKLNNFISMENT